MERETPASGNLGREARAMIGVVLDELEVNAAGAAFDFWLSHLNEQLEKRHQEPVTPTRDDAIDSIERAIIHAVSAKLRIAQALEDDFPPSMSFQQLLHATYDPSERWHYDLDR